MIDALKGHPVWSEHYDFNIKDTFKIQNDIILEMVKSAGAKYEKLIGESRPVAGTNNIDAYLSLWNCFHYYQKGSPEGYRKSKEQCEQSIAFDPNYFWPYIGLALAHTVEARWGISESPEKSMERALNMAQMAVKLGKTHPQAHAAMGRVLYSSREHDKAIAVLKRAIALNPENADAQSWLGWTLNYAGRSQEAIPIFKKLMRSTPLTPQWALLGLGGANLFVGNYEAAIPYYQKIIEIEGGAKYYRVYLDLAACYAALGRQEEAEAVGKEVLKLNPKFTMKKHLTSLPAKDPEFIKPYTDALRKLELLE